MKTAFSFAILPTFIAAFAVFGSDIVGEWTTGHQSNPVIGGTIYKSKDAHLEISNADLLVHLIGQWKIIPEGRWKGHFVIAGRVDFLRVGSQDVTPANGRFEMLVGVENDQLLIVKSGFPKDANGSLVLPFEHVPILKRQNDRIPDKPTIDY